MTGERPAASGQGAVAGSWPLAAGRSPLALLLLYAALVVPALFTRDLWDPDEPRFAQIGREMLRTGDWVLPRMNGEPLALLPPLHDWISAAFGALAGDVTPAASRAGSALGGLLALASLWLLARRWWGAATAGWSAVVLMTCTGFWLQSSYAQVDMLLVGFVTASIASFRAAWEADDRGLKWFLCGCAFAAFGTLTKGPVAAVLPGLVFLALALAERRRGFIRPAWLAAGLALYLTITVPWYLLACRRGGPDFTHELLVKHNFGMFFETWSHHQPPWYYLISFLWMFAPWIAFVPAAVLDSRVALRPSAPSLARALFRPESRDAEADRHRFLWIWFVALFLFFSISQAKQGKYLLPAFPAAALLVGKRLASPAGVPRHVLRILAGAAAVVIVVAGQLAISQGNLLPWKYREDATILVLPAFFAVMGLSAWLAAPFTVFRNRERELVAGGFACTLLLVGFAVFPRIDRLKSARPLCDRIRARVGAGAELGIYGIQERKIGAFRYYLDRPLSTFEDPGEHPDPVQLAGWWSKRGPRWLIADAADIEGLPRDLRESLQPLETADVGHRKIVAIRREWYSVRVTSGGMWFRGETATNREALISDLRELRPPGVDRVDRCTTMAIRAEEDSPTSAVLELISAGAEAGVVHYDLEIGSRNVPIELPVQCGSHGKTWSVRVALCSADPADHDADWEKHGAALRGKPVPRLGHGWIRDSSEPQLLLVDEDSCGLVARQAVARAGPLPPGFEQAEIQLEVDPNFPAGRFLDTWIALRAAGWPGPIPVQPRK